MGEGDELVPHRLWNLPARHNVHDAVAAVNVLQIELVYPRGAGSSGVVRWWHASASSGRQKG